MLLRAPEVLDHLTVGFDVRAEDEHVQPVRAGLERARHARADAHSVKRLELDELVIELHTPAPGDNDRRSPPPCDGGGRRPLAVRA